MSDAATRQAARDVAMVGGVEARARALAHGLRSGELVAVPCRECHGTGSHAGCEARYHPRRTCAAWLDGAGLDARWRWSVCCVCEGAGEVYERAEDAAREARAALNAAVMALRSWRALRMAWRAETPTCEACGDAPGVVEVAGSPTSDPDRLLCHACAFGDA